MAVERMNELTYAEGLGQYPACSQQLYACSSTTELSLYSEKEQFYATIPAWGTLPK